MHRRDFLRVGSLAGIGRHLEAAPAAAASCIVLPLPGGLSHLDTFDMKPDAPAHIRGEFRAIRTNVPGIRICEHLPRTARIADKLTILRSMCSGETNHERATRSLDFREFDGIVPAARFVTVGAGRADYDTHTDNFRRLRDELLPAFDRRFSALITDLEDRELLSTTLVVAITEFGRTPRINSFGGRDHHSRAWSVVLAGAGLPGGRVLGATDRTGTDVTDLPVSPGDLVETVRAILKLRPEPERAAGRVVAPVLA